MEKFNQYDSYEEPDIETVPDLVTSNKTILFTNLEQLTTWLENPDSDTEILHTYYILLLKILGSERDVRADGGGVMAAFWSPVDAVRAAVEIQKQWEKVRRNKKLLPRIKIGLSTGETYQIVKGNPPINDYLGRVPAEARKICNIAQGGHILMATEGLKRGLIYKKKLAEEGIRFSSTVVSSLGHLGSVEIFEVNHDGIDEHQVIPMTCDESGFMMQLCRNSDDARPYVDELLSKSQDLDFLHVRGIVKKSSSPFKRFIDLMDENKKLGFNNIRILIQNPVESRLMDYYVIDKKEDLETANHSVGQCRNGLDLAKTRLKGFVSKKRIKKWEIHVYKIDPIWRLAITNTGFIAAPYGGSGKMSQKNVFICNTPDDPLYLTFKRHFDSVLNNSTLFASSEDT